MALKILLWTLCGLLSLPIIPQLYASTASPQKIRVLYNSLNELSLSQLLAFYQLYPQTQEGERALNNAWALLSGSSQKFPPALITALPSLGAMINQLPDNALQELNANALQLIDKLAANFPNRALKGFRCTSENALLLLAPEEIDIARGTLLAQLGNDFKAQEQMQRYEAALDLMALQIRAQLPQRPTAQDKIRAINHFLFFEVGFRFPPHDQYTKEIDQFTFLPSVLDSRRGVCLGVSLLYLALGQRLDLPLEMITPPGHIFVRYHSPAGEVINIETTARGVHIDSEEYLSIDTLKLRQRNLKEVIGLALHNEASIYIGKNEYSKALECYSHAEQYLPGDRLLKELMGYCYLLSHEHSRGIELLKEVCSVQDEYNICSEGMAPELIAGTLDDLSLEVLLSNKEEDRQALLTYIEELKNAQERCPQSKALNFALAGCWLELKRYGEALEALNRCHCIDPEDAKVEFYLAALYGERNHYPHAWKHLRYAEELCAEHSHTPRLLKELRRHLSSYAAPPLYTARGPI